MRRSISRRMRSRTSGETRVELRAQQVVGPRQQAGGFGGEQIDDGLGDVGQAAARLLRADVRGHAPEGFLAGEPDAVGDLVGKRPLASTHSATTSRRSVLRRGCGRSRNANGSIARNSRNELASSDGHGAPSCASAAATSCWRKSARKPSQAPRSADVGNGFQLVRASSAPSSLARVQSPDMIFLRLFSLSWPAVESRGIARAPLVAASQVLRLVFGMPSILSQPARGFCDESHKVDRRFRYPSSDRRRGGHTEGARRIEALRDAHLAHRMRSFQGAFRANPDTLWYGWSEWKRDLAEVKQMASDCEPNMDLGHAVTGRPREGDPTRPVLAPRPGNV